MAPRRGVMVTWHGQFLEEGACAWPAVRAEHPPGSFAELVEVVLQNVDLALDLLMGGHLRCDEDPAGGIDCRALQGNLQPGGDQLVAGLDVQPEDADAVHGPPPQTLSKASSMACAWRRRPIPSEHPPQSLKGHKPGRAH